MQTAKEKNVETRRRQTLKRREKQRRGQGRGKIEVRCAARAWAERLQSKWRSVPPLSVFIKSSRAGTAAAKRIDFLSPLEKGGRQKRRAIVGISVFLCIRRYENMMEASVSKWLSLNVESFEHQRGSKCRRCRVVSWPVLLISRRDLLRLPSQSQPPLPARASVWVNLHQVSPGDPSAATLAARVSLSIAAGF